MTNNLLQLDAAHARAILDFLGCPATRPTLRNLNRLIDAYTHRVPWESAFRIVKRHTTPDTVACPRWPEEFWRDALTRGGGGTCFESNYAFWSLLDCLGYRGYLTINDMGQQRACHTAVVVQLDDASYLVDVGIPLHRALRLHTAHTARRRTAFHTYLAQPFAPQRYAIERTRHPKRNIYTLLDTPITLAAYRTALTQDYEPSGLFLDRVIITKIIGGVIWRFSSAEQPFALESFDTAGRKHVQPLSGQPAAALAAHFGMDAHVVAAALSIVHS